MKNLSRILLLTLLFVFTLKAFAQPSKSTWLTSDLGITSVWIMNQNVYGNQEMNYATKFGLQGAIGLNHFIDTKYGLGTGVGFMNLGQNYSGDQAGAQAIRKVNLNYIQVPFTIMRQLRDPQHPSWLTLGPQIMVLTSATQYYSREEGGSLLHNKDYLPKGKKDVTKWYKPVDVMISLGITNIYTMRTNDAVRFMWSFNTAFGLLDVNAKDYQIPNSRDIYKSSHNFYMVLQAGLMFNQ